MYIIYDALPLILRQLRKILAARHESGAIDIAATPCLWHTLFSRQFNRAFICFLGCPMEQPSDAERPNDPAPPLSREIFLRGRAVDAPTGLLDREKTGQSVSFRIVGQLGQGGMGMVFRAEQLYPRRVLALKVLKQSLADAHSQKRFVREMEITGRLNHRNIAQLYFAGYLDDGQPFMAMELVEGVPLTTYAKAHDLSREERLKLFAKVCDVVAYAHRHGVLHRDLKPSNILVDAQGDPKVLDFGLAALPRELDATQLTIQGQMVGTLDYMSPEQAAGEKQVSYPSDVYALGIILYELLATKRPFELSSVSIIDALRVIRESTPPQLSGVNRACRGDLETIVHKALAKEVARRYESVEALAEDLRRWLTHEPIKARPPSAIYRAGRFVRRHRLLVTAVCFIVASLGLGLAIATDQAVKANASAKVADAAAANAQQEAARAIAAEKASNEQRTRSDIQTIEKSLILGEKLANVVDPLGAIREFATAKGLLERNHLPMFPLNLRIADFGRRYAIPIRKLPFKPTGISKLELHQENRYLAIGRTNGRVEICDLQRGEIFQELSVVSTVHNLQFSPDGKHLMVSCKDVAVLWSTEQGRSIIAFEIAPGSADRVQIDDDRIIYLSAERRIMTRSIGEPDVSELLSNAPADALALRLIKDQAILVDSNWAVLNLDFKTKHVSQMGQLARGRPTAPIQISTDGSKIAVNREGKMFLFDQKSGNETELSGVMDTTLFGFVDGSTLFAHRPQVPMCQLLDSFTHEHRLLPRFPDSAVAWTSDRAVTTSPHDGLVLWSIKPSFRSAVQHDGVASIVAGDLSHDGKWVVIGGQDGILRLAESGTGRVKEKFEAGMPLKKVAIFSNGVAALSERRVVRLFRLDDPAWPKSFTRTSILDFDISDDGNLLCLTFPGAELEFSRNAGSDWESHVFKAPMSVRTIDFSIDTRYAFIIYRDNQSELLNLEHDVTNINAKSASEIKWKNMYAAHLDRISSTIRLRSHDGTEAAAIPVGSLDFSRPALSLTGVMVTAFDGNLVFFNREGIELGRIRNNIPNLRDLHLSDDGTKLLVIGMSDFELLDFSAAEETYRNWCP